MKSFQVFLFMALFGVLIAQLEEPRPTDPEAIPEDPVLIPEGPENPPDLVDDVPNVGPLSPEFGPPVDGLNDTLNIPIYIEAPQTPPPIILEPGKDKIKLLLTRKY